MKRMLMKNSHFRLAAFLWFTAFLLIYPARVSCQAVQADKEPVVDSQLRKRLVEQIIRELKAKYVAPEKVKEIESQLRKRLQSGAYDKIDKAREMASSLTDDLRAAGKDLHLLVAYDPDLERALLATAPTPSVDLKELPPTAERLAALRNSNYNFRKVEIMRGNVGYLELRSFVDLTYSKETAVAAMSFLANTDAIIIDLRKNPGGFINLEIFLASYFYPPEPVEWLSRYHHDTNVTVKDWILREVPGKRIPNIDLYILTSGETGSAAEGFSFMLQQRKRATIIGEKTSGAGYGNKEMAIGDGFVFFVSIFRQFDPRTGRGWQEVGVEPDIVVKSERALNVAHAEAVKNLSAKATDAHRKQQLGWLGTLLELEAYGPKQISTSLLENYAGKYDQGKIVVSLEQGQLYFLGASGVRRPLQALTDDSFLIVDASVPPENQARVRFVKNAEGVVTELHLMVSDGRTFPRAKVQDVKGADTIKNLIDDFVSADWQKVHTAESALESLQAEALPALVSLLDRDERIELDNTMDLIYPGAKQFSGHGWILDYDVDWISVRAGWAIEELTFQNFGFREGVINNDDLLKAVISRQRNVRLTDPSRTPDMKKQIRAEAVSRAKAWWQKAHQSWNRFDALLEALRSGDAVRQHWTLDWIIHGRTKCDGLTAETFKKFIEPELKRLLNSSNERVREQATSLLKDKERSWLQYKTESK